MGSGYVLKLLFCEKSQALSSTTTEAREKKYEKI
jgi:hypothetical protein